MYVHVFMRLACVCHPVAVLVAALHVHTGHSGVVETCASALGNLAASHDANMKRITNHGGGMHHYNV